MASFFRRPKARPGLIAGFLLSHLQRVTSGKRFIPQIDGLRFVAILSVVLFHIHGSLAFGGGAVRSPFSQPLMQFLSSRGVQLFFVISGFILGLPYASARMGLGEQVRLRQYFLRRVTRLEPPYILNLVLCLVLSAIIFHVAIVPKLPHLAASLIYAHQVIYGEPSTINVALWSLEVEIQFYLLVPLLAYLFAIRPAQLRRVMIGLLILIFGVFSNRWAGTAGECSFLYYGAFFLAGFLLCDLYLLRGKSWDRPSWIWDGVALVGWPLVWFPEQRITHVLLPFLIVILYLTAFRGRFFSWLFGRPVLTAIGGMCYSIYLFHYFAISALGKLSKPIHIGHNFAFYFMLQALIILPGVLFVSTVFYLLVERPCMNKYWPRDLSRWLAGRWRHLFAPPIPSAAPLFHSRADE